MFISFPVV